MSSVDAEHTDFIVVVPLDPRNMPDYNAWSKTQGEVMPLKSVQW